MTYKEFNAVVLPLKDKMYRCALYMLGDRMDAEDVVQDVYEKLWTKKNTLPLLENLEAYVFRSVKNLCCDRLSSQKLHREKLEDIRINTNESVYDNRAEERNLKSILDKEIAALPEKQKMVVFLRDVEGYEMEEIAKLLDMEEPNVRVVLSRARKLLREKMIKIMSYGLQQ
jgi:RNA polymerase sigma-70 factor (ECF subfamily)